MTPAPFPDPEAAIRQLFSSISAAPVEQLDKLPQAGSERQYYRLHTAAGNYIATLGANLRENESFLWFSRHFAEKALRTPRVLAVSADGSLYIQEDVGSTSLLDILEKEGYTDDVYALYRQSLRELARLQILGHEGMDYSHCLTNAEFGKEAIMADLLYFKYYFLDALRRPYDKQKLLTDFEALSNYLAHTEYRFFMFRDFQSRNIMVNDDRQVAFIDYQGGMLGAPQYDAASLLWQAKASLPEAWKQSLLEQYVDDFEAILQAPVDREVFRSQYNGYVLIRLLQVLGAYGFRGLFERKAHFLTSIPLGLQNLKRFLSQHRMGIAVPEFSKVLGICTSDEVIREFTPLQATPDTPLRVSISSFSFLQNGYPADETGNGGGFVFDMRGILNPGRFDEYKHLSGLDKPVKDFLEQRTKMPEFLNSMFSIVDISVEEYIRRGFEHLSVNFGCTGGQHRSVYAAEALARHLRNKFKLKPDIHHRNRTNWKTG